MVTKKRPGILEILTMDGRKKAPHPAILQPHPQAGTPNAATVKRVITQFEKTGHSGHSGMGLLLPYIVAYCQAKGYSFRLTAQATVNERFIGYTVERIPNLK